MSARSSDNLFESGNKLPKKSDLAFGTNYSCRHVFVVLVRVEVQVVCFGLRRCLRCYVGLQRARGGLPDNGDRGTMVGCGISAILKKESAGGIR